MLQRKNYCLAKCCPVPWRNLCVAPNVLLSQVLLPEPSEKFQLESLDKFPQSEFDEKVDEIAPEEEDESAENSEESKAADNGAKKFELLNHRIVTVTEENQSQYTIFDVIMPTPGWRVQCPDILKEIYERVNHLKNNLQWGSKLRTTVGIQLMALGLPDFYWSVFWRPFGYQTFCP